MLVLVDLILVELKMSPRSPCEMSAGGVGVRRLMRTPARYLLKVFV